MNKKKRNADTAETGLGAAALKEIREKQQQAGILLQAGRFAQADYLCQEILKKYPQEAHTWFFRGAIANNAGRHTDAQGFLQEALRLAPGRLPYLQALATVYAGLRNFQEAAQVYAQIIALQPHDAQAHFNRGNALGALGAVPEAIEAYTQAWRLEPKDWRVVFNRGLLQQKIHQHAAAADDFAQVLRLKPDEVGAHYSHGLALRNLQQHAQALEAFEQVLALQPQHADAYNALGTTLAAMEQPQAALAQFEHALRINPLLTEAYLNRGLALHDLRRYEEELDSYRKALSFGGAPAAVHYHMGNALNELRRHEEAIASYGQASALGYDSEELRLNQIIAHTHVGDRQHAAGLLEAFVAEQPEHVPAQLALADCYLRMRQLPQALAVVDRVLQWRPHMAAALNLRGMVFFAMDQQDQALESFDAALATDPGWIAAQFYRGQVLGSLKRNSEAVQAYTAVVQAQPDYPYALGYLVHTQLQLCQWDDYDAHVQRLRQRVREGAPGDTPFAFLSVGQQAADQQACAVQFSKQLLTQEAPLWSGQHYGHDRIRVAYVSADFGDHPTSYLMGGLFEQHDRQRFEIYGVALQPVQPTFMGQSIKAAFDHFIDVSQLSDLQAAQWLRAQEIDIAVDLMGYTNHHRAGIFMHRPAPVHVNYLGYPGTLGSSCIDYILADEVLIPASHQQYYTENVVYLPGSFQVNDDLRAAAQQLPSRAECGLPDDGLVFCSFNGHHKLHPQFFAIWMRLLQQVPGSVLWLVDPGADAGARLRDYAAAQGVDPQRLVWAPKRAYDQHLARLSLADLFLDSLPFGAGATASDALFAGVPLLTCAGDAFSGRMAASLLHALGLSETLVTDDVAAYEARALALAQQPERLQAVRRQLALARRSSSLFNTATFARHVEQAYRQMCLRVLQGLPAQGFSVSP
jgi:predicted O-linked N-acetylglucosamine transferase (SPINDLY family)